MPKYLYAIFVVLVFACFSTNCLAQKHAETDEVMIQAIQDYKYLHEHPELSLKEVNTASYLAKALLEMGFDVYENYAGNSLVAVLKNGKGKSVLYRTEMDALPIKEATSFDFKSNVVTQSGGREVGVMHACGHDIHMATWLATLRRMVAQKNDWNGTLIAIAQEAEELGAGAKKLLKKGVYDDFGMPNAALAYHLNPDLPSTSIAVSAGPVFAGVKNIDVTIYGKGGHGAYPERCKDPIVMSAEFVQGLQRIVSRETSATDPIVLTVGSINGGSRHNIIPDSVKMQLTLRYYNEDLAHRIIDHMQVLGNGIASSWDLEPDLYPKVEDLNVDVPPVNNDESLALQIREYAVQAIGLENVMSLAPVMIGEDFGKYGLFSEDIQSCMIWLGGSSEALIEAYTNDGKKPPSLHSSTMAPDYRKSITTGTTAMAAILINLLK